MSRINAIHLRKPCRFSATDRLTRTSRDSLQTSPVSGDIDKLGNPMFQSPRPNHEKDKKNDVGNDEPKSWQRIVELPIEQERKREQINDHGRRNKTIGEPDPRQAFRTSMIFRDAL